MIYNFFILANSKLHILKCVDMLIRNLDTTAFRLCYMDTGEFLALEILFGLLCFSDSLVMSQSKELEEMVKPEMRENWEEEKKKWFVLDDSIDQQREPGKF